MTLSLSSQNVLQYLVDIGLCRSQDLDSLQVEPTQLAKNFNLLVSVPEKGKLLVKQERLDANGQSANEFCNEWLFHELVKKNSTLYHLAASVSELLHFDSTNSILVYNYLIDYRDLEKFYHRKAQSFPVIIAASIGAILATLHRETLNCSDCRDFISQIPEGTSRHVFGNPANSIERIGPEIFGIVPSDCLKFFILYQRYESLGNAIADLATHWHPCCVVHNDLKLNNILIHNAWEEFPKEEGCLEDGIVRIIDWERCSWGDPAFDLGTILASFLMVWLSSLVVDPSIALEESLRLAGTLLEVMQPSITALTNAYFSHFPTILRNRPDFLKRVVQFTGLALINQIQALTQYQKTFGNTGICMLQVAKSLLCRPEQSMFSIFGISESELLALSMSAA
ncbi:MAG: hypothetical protein Fur006_40990 [Coleofasciculaceae cyanobacterium]